MVVIFIVAAFACNTGVDKRAETADSSTIAIPDNTQNKINVPGKFCFQRIMQKDTIAIELFVKDTSVSGNLVYRLYEKDSNAGTIKGSIHNDIILADYTFASEGKTSVRQVIFKLKDGILTEGYGETLMVNDKFIFKDTSRINYTQVFDKVDCK